MTRVFTDASKERICVLVEGREPVILKHLQPTVNQAELSAIFQALTSVHDVEEVISDSELSVKLITGVYRVGDNDNIYNLVQDIRDANRMFHNNRARFTHVHREQNLAGIALEKYEKQLRREERRKRG